MLGQKPGFCFLADVTNVRILRPLGAALTPSLQHVAGCSSILLAYLHSCGGTIVMMTNKNGCCGHDASHCIFPSGPGTEKVCAQFLIVFLLHVLTSGHS